jgi:hypothetical protein
MKADGLPNIIEIREIPLVPGNADSCFINANFRLVVENPDGDGRVGNGPWREIRHRDFCVDLYGTSEVGHYNFIIKKEGEEDEES